MKTRQSDTGNFEQRADAIRSGSRRELARAITLVESTRKKDIDDAQKLLEILIPHSGKSIRIGISGVPGVGKSTWIQALGLELLEKKHKVAVLAVDPSSPKTGGSILGDKIRMPEFARSGDAFIRPTPAGKTSGGVARKTRESILLCEAAGFDIILVETVGSGQSEWQVANMVDFFVVLMLPNAGDSLQGMKRGMLELADAIFVNKADGELKQAASRAVGEYKNALEITGGRNVGVLIRECSGLDRDTVASCWNQITEEITKREQTSAFGERREAQLREWIRSLAADSLWSAIHENPELEHSFDALVSEVRNGSKSPLYAGLAYRRLVLSKLAEESDFDVPL